MEVYGSLDNGKRDVYENVTWSMSFKIHVTFSRTYRFPLYIEPYHPPHICKRGDTVYPKKFAQGFCFAVLCCGYTLTDFPISIRFTSLALWQSNDCPSASKATLMNMDKYFMWIHYERLHNHNKAKYNKTVCIFLGIYCTLHGGSSTMMFINFFSWYHKQEWSRVEYLLNLLIFIILFSNGLIRTYTCVLFKTKIYHSIFPYSNTLPLYYSQVYVTVQQNYLSSVWLM